MGYVGKYPHRIKNASYGKSGIWVITLNNGRVHRINGRDMPGAMPKPGEEISKYLDEGLPMVKLAVNPAKKSVTRLVLSLIHISEPTRRHHVSRMPSSA